jgi:hypothetical protein
LYHPAEKWQIYVFVSSALEVPRHPLPAYKFETAEFWRWSRNHGSGKAGAIYSSLTREKIHEEIGHKFWAWRLGFDVKNQQRLLKMAHDVSVKTFEIILGFESRTRHETSTHSFVFETWRQEVLCSMLGFAPKSRTMEQLLRLFGKSSGVAGSHRKKERCGPFKLVP